MNYSTSRYQQKQNDIKLLILIPCRGTMQEGLVKWLWQAIPQAPFSVVWDTVHGRPEDDTRNKATRFFLDDPRQFTHLMMIDDDIIPPANTLQMVLHGKSVVSAVVFTWKDGQPLALLMKWNEEEQGLKQDTEAIARINKGERLIQVDASGTGCFVVKREVYENLVTNWFRYQYDNDGQISMGEDFNFYYKLMKMGYKTWVDGQVVCGHVGSIDIKEIQDALTRRNNENNQSNDKEKKN